MKHLDECGENYFNHMIEALLIVLTLFVAGLICFIHSLLPFIFQNTASTMIRKILKRTDSRYAR